MSDEVSAFEYRHYLVTVDRGGLLLMASAVSKLSARGLRKLVTATHSEGEAVLMRRVKLAIDDELRLNKDEPALHMPVGALSAARTQGDEA